MSEGNRQDAKSAKDRQEGFTEEHKALSEGSNCVADYGEIIESYISPDGLLRLIVCDPGEGDITIGFAGFAWHTHSDILSELSGQTETAAVRELVDAIVQDESVLVLTYIDGKVTEVVPTDNPEDEISGYAKYGIPNERIMLRYWSGKPYESWKASP